MSDKVCYTRSELDAVMKKHISDNAEILRIKLQESQKKEHNEIMYV